MYQELSAEPGFHLPWEPELSVVSFRFIPGRGDADSFNQELLQRINATGRIFLSSTTLGGGTSCCAPAS